MRRWELDNPTRPWARPPDDSPWRSARDDDTGGARRLSEAERRAMRARRAARTGDLEAERPEVTRGERASRPVPRMPKTSHDTRVRSPAITLAGALLIVGLTVLAFAGGRLFGRVEQPTPVVGAQA